MENEKTKSWILRHPARVGSIGQIQVMRSTPDFASAMNEASRFYSMVNERYTRSRVVGHDTTKEYFTVIELSENSTEEDARNALFANEGIIRKMHISDVFVSTR